MPEVKNTTPAEIVAKMTAKELLSAICGGELPASISGITVVDLNEIDPSVDFESPGLHKRARAEISALQRRGRENVRLAWNSARLSAPGGYSGSDRKLIAFIGTEESTWGSHRGCYLIVIDGYHYSGGGAISDCLFYEPVRGLFGVVTDSEGKASCLVRLEVPNPDWRVPQRDPLHEEVSRIWLSLSAWLRSQVLEEAFSRLD